MDFNQIVSLLLKISFYFVIVLIFLAGLIYAAR